MINPGVKIEKFYFSKIILDLLLARREGHKLSKTIENS
jgi:hypothetical protein